MEKTWIVEIYNAADFCNIVKQFACCDESRANFLAGVWLDKFADSGDKWDKFDYRVYELEIME